MADIPVMGMLLRILLKTVPVAWFILLIKHSMTVNYTLSIAHNYLLLDSIPHFEQLQHR